MYLKLKAGKRGEVVIPAILRRKYGIKPGRQIKAKADEYRLEFIFDDIDVVGRFREIAKREKMKSSELVYGDRLYEEVFG